MSRLVVATDCPSCGAPLDFSEGSNMVRCGHCRSNLLVTGRKQVLSYSIQPRLAERHAVALAVRAQRDRGFSGFRDTRSRLCFVPYYRMTGHDFAWEEPPPKPREEEERDGIFTTPQETDRAGLQVSYEELSEFFTATKEFINEFSSWVFGRSPEAVQKEPPAVEHTAPPAETGSPPQAGEGRFTKGFLYDNGRVLLHDRYIEKNFLACSLTGTGIYSLGVRPSVLSLELFRRNALSSLGSIVRPDLTPETAEDSATKNAEDRFLLYREVVGKALSVIYFPFWIVEMDCGGRHLLTIVDAVSRAVVKADADPSLSSALSRELDAEPRVIGFRPVTCPNCGWDLPLRPDDSVFPCGSCHRAWQIHGQDLIDTAYVVAKVPAGAGPGPVRYLPFWSFDADVFEHGRFLFPAFRYRRLRLLIDLALRINRLRPSYSLTPERGPELSGCFYDQEDAATLARFSAACLDAARPGDLRTFNKSAFSIGNAVLTYLPFTVRGAYLHSPFGGISMAANLLL